MIHTFQNLISLSMLNKKKCNPFSVRQQLDHRENKCKMNIIIAISHNDYYWVQDISSCFFRKTKSL